MGDLFKAVFSQPIFNLLIWLYDVVPGKDIGVAIILLTVIVKMVLWPFSQKALKSQKALSDLQPKVEALKKQYGADKEGHAKAIMALYSQEKVSPMSSCLPILIQLPVLIALYHSLSQGLKSSGFEMLYPFVANPGTLQSDFLGLLDLSVPSYVLAILAGIGQFFQTKMMVTTPQAKGTPGAEDEQMLATMNKQMVYMMPVLTVFISWKLPGGLALYWLVTNLLTIGQQALFMKKPKPVEAKVQAVK
jgi:YidC/Oxa1 family membrane protein insertase